MLKTASHCIADTVHISKHFLRSTLNQPSNENENENENQTREPVGSTFLPPTPKHYYSMLSSYREAQNIQDGRVAQRRSRTVARTCMVEAAGAGPRFFVRTLCPSYMQFTATRTRECREDREARKTEEMDVGLVRWWVCIMGAIICLYVRINRSRLPCTQLSYPIQRRGIKPLQQRSPGAILSNSLFSGLEVYFNLHRQKNIKISSRGLFTLQKQYGEVAYDTFPAFFVDLLDMPLRLKRRNRAYRVAPLLGTCSESPGCVTPSSFFHPRAERHTASRGGVAWHGMAGTA